MWKPRPGKWLLWAPPMVVMTTLAAHMLNSGGLFRDIAARAGEQLAANGASWAKLNFAGRDVLLQGDAPSQQAIDSALKALKGTYGVRTVASAARIVVPIVLASPTVKGQIANSSTPEITGKWQEGVAKTFAVTLAGKAYKFGTDPELKTNAGTWVLKPAAPLADGAYEITAEVSDGVNPPVGSAAPAKLVIDTLAPAAPAITPLASGIQWPFTLNGTWVEDGATFLVAKLAEQTWTLGKDEDLKSDGKGNWSFAPVIDLRPGTYDITLETSDMAGNISKATLAAAIVIPEPETPGSAAIPAPVAAVLPEPTLKSATIMEARPTLAGTWPEAAATGLSVTLAGKTYVLGTDAALASDGAGNWNLKSESVLKDGAYDVVVAATNAAGVALAITSTINVDAAAPATPTVKLYAGEGTPPSAQGTWAEGDATSLKVSIPQAGLEAALDDGTGPLASDGKGNWSLAISKILEPGSYDVIVESADKAGRKSFDQTRFELNIKAPVPAPVPVVEPEPVQAAAPKAPPAPAPAVAPTPQAPPAPYDCAGVLAKISAIFPLRFEFNQSQLKPPLDLTINQYAALLKDPRCAAEKAVIAGHTDFFGPRLYNQALSEWRAQTVLGALVAAGVDASRLSTKGFSESAPADPEKSVAARKKNRRAEIALVK